MPTDAHPGRRGIASRAGPIHVFDSDSPVSPDAFAEAAADWADVPVVVRSDRGASVVGSGRLVGGHVDGDDLIGTIVWPADIEEMAGDADSTARCEWDADGRLVRVVVDLDEGPDGDDDSDDDESAGDAADDHESCECEACRSGGTCGDDPESDESDETSTTNPPPAGASEDPPMPAASPAKPRPDDSALDPDVKNSVVLKRLIDKYGSLDKAASKLVAMNIRQGEQIKELEGRVAAAPEVPEGSSILPKSDADLLAAYRELGDPKALRESIDAADAARAAAERDRDAARKELGDLSRAATLKEIAAKAGYVPDVFLDRVGHLPADAAFEPATVKVRGGDVETFAVKYKDGDGKEVSRTLDDLESSDWAAYLPALKPGARANPGEPGQRDRDRAASATGFRGGFRAGERPTRQPADADPMDVARHSLVSDLHIGI